MNSLIIHIVKLQFNKLLQLACLSEFQLDWGTTCVYFHTLLNTIVIMQKIFQTECIVLSFILFKSTHYFTYVCIYAYEYNSIIK